ncbi:MAG TPA: L-threonylcarbamoyladenylate synthase [Gemmatimonadaceae bacterium]|nr:L-threonylcarbamoyladenylate synthase [Gemmatimonadaceae bacterium]
MALIQVDPRHPDPAVIARAAELLRAGRLVAFPTETVYGLGANALDPAAVARIFEAKGRPSFNPLIVHAVDARSAFALMREWNERAIALADAFWPGPLTLVMPKQPRVPDIVTAGLDSVAVRVPAHPVAQALLAEAKIPIAAPSANRSTMLSPTIGRHVQGSLGERVDLILDAGPTPVGIESTVIDVSHAMPTLLRPGTITVPEIEAVIGPIAIAAAATEGAARPSPGMMERHYSPRARLVMADATDVERIVSEERGAGLRVGALVMNAPVVVDDSVIVMPSEARAYAARLYGALHELDDAGCEVVVVERVPDSIEWLGLRDRLQRAVR